MLLLPILVGIIVVLLRVPVPAALEPMLSNPLRLRINTAMEYFPVAFFCYVLVGHIKQAQWRWLIGWSITICSLAAAWVALSLFSESRSLAPEERIGITMWHFPLVVGFYATSSVATILVVVDAVVRKINAKFQM